MNPDEYRKLAEVERDHWFYAGKRDIVRYWLRQVRPISPQDLLVDCGAGTGTFAVEMSSLCRVLAIDDHAESLDMAREKLGADQVRQGACSRLPLPDASVDMLTALDVLEHVREDRAAVGEFARVVRPGGAVVITVPALMALWSDWDVVLHHFRRYNRRSLLAIVPSDPFELVHLNYINVAVLPVVYLVRKTRVLKNGLGLKSASRAEDSIPPRWLNNVLRWLFVTFACQRRLRFPAGVSLVAVLRRK